MKTLAGGKSKATAGRFKDTFGGSHARAGGQSGKLPTNEPRFINGPNIKSANPLQDLQPSVLRYVK